MLKRPLSVFCLHKLRYSSLGQLVSVVPMDYGERTEDIYHKHDFSELVVVQSGSGRHVTDQGSYRIYPGNIFLIPPGVPHGYEEVDHLVLSNVTFFQDELAPFLAPFRKDPGYLSFFELDPQYSGNYRFRDRLILTKDELRRINHCIAEICREQQEQKPLWQNIINSIFCQLAGEICRSFHHQLTQDSDDVRLLNSIIGFFMQNLASPIRLPLVAKRFNSSEATLNRLFRSALQTSPINYLIELRMLRAAERLGESRERVGTIAAECGFEDTNYFSKMFHRRFGVSPREYRARALMQSLPNREFTPPAEAAPGPESIHNGEKA